MNIQFENPESYELINDFFSFKISDKNTNGQH